jgi:hypothetical protein
MAQGQLLDPGRCIVVAAVQVILLLALAAPVAGSEITVFYNTTDAVKNAIASASNDDVIILEPNTYFEYGITVSKSITIRANTSYGHNAADTIVDGMEGGSSIITINSGNTLNLDNLTLQNGTTSLYGGAIYNKGTLSITSCTFSDCDVTFNGGAICGAAGTITIMSSTFSDCTAGGGGALYSTEGTVTIQSSTFNGCTADNGGAIFNEKGTVIVRFSRIYGNTASSQGQAIYNWGRDAGSITAENNWWGSNNDPSSQVFGNIRPVTTSPWLVLNASASLLSVTTSRTATIRMNLTNASTGTTITDTAGGGIFVPDTGPVTFSLSGVSGNLLPGTGRTLAGANTSTFAPTASGTATITVTVDGQSVTIPITVTDPVTPTATTTTFSASSGMESNDDTTVRTLSSAGTVTANIGGNSKAYQVVVTGTGLKDLIVTGTVQAGPGTTGAAPPGTVYQYISLVPARYTTITKAVISFTVPKQQMDENHIDPATIVLYHQTADGWKALPTTFLSTKDGNAYFSAETRGFSLFAIAGTPGSASNTTTTSSPAVVAVSSGREKAEAAAIVTKAPVTTQTTAPTASYAPTAAQHPVVSVVLASAAIVFMGAGGFLARRWWLRRQNPALYEEY